MSGEAAKALVAALAKIDAVPKGSKVKTDKFSYTYADLAAVIAACRQPLADNGLVAVQSVTGEPGSVSVTTILLHESGDKIEFGPLTMRAGGTPQEVGSAITYARRYSLLAALGIATEDDDGHAAAQAKPQNATLISASEAEALVAVMNAVQGEEQRRIKRDFVNKFGKPQTVLAEYLEDAWAWVELQTQEAGQ